MGGMEGRSLQYNPALDGLRAFAVMAVLVFHAAWTFLPGGFIGVDVFFVLSGYLITTMLRAEVAASGQIDLRRFYWRRAVRLWPPLLLMLAAYVAAAPIAFAEADAGLDAILAGLYMSDYSVAIGGMPDFISHTWSLSAEVHFYLVWPLIIIATRRLSDRRVALAFGVLFILASSWRIADLAFSQDALWTYYRFDTRLSGLVLGGLIAVLPWRPSKLSSTVLSGVALMILGWAVCRWQIVTPWSLTLGAVIVDLAAGALIVSLASRGRTPISSALSWPPLVYLGAISYSIYLWHYPIARVLRNQVDPVTMIVIVTVASVAIAALSYEYVEKPLMALRRRQAVAA